MRLINFDGWEFTVSESTWIDLCAAWDLGGDVDNLDSCPLCVKYDYQCEKCPAGGKELVGKYGRVPCDNMLDRYFACIFGRRVKDVEEEAAVYDVLINAPKVKRKPPKPKKPELRGSLVFHSPTRLLPDNKIGHGQRIKVGT